MSDKPTKRIKIEQAWDALTGTYQVRLMHAGGRYFWMTEAEAQTLRDDLTRTLRVMRNERTENAPGSPRRPKSTARH